MMADQIHHTKLIITEAVGLILVAIKTTEGIIPAKKIRYAFQLNFLLSKTATEIRPQNPKSKQSKRQIIELH